ncbi:SEC-C motif-containing protein [Wenyingzhuangia heitensis]|uniref:SEC-C motif-containing protein n=1 Tax=Wenyingzhuangia heitensis TaxID=1487859 RepID=A0ABX0UGB9_9FLAO|nr:YchJ family metal-binding protein [Wenyingzhuangia heitensis]NIJ46451.1 SEC-C motif-containing protein [Wenyingzhuangia heitensis]
MSKFSKLVQKQKENQSSKKHRFNLEARTNANREVVLCSCGSNKSYKVCCGVFHQDILKVQTPLELMKSRYTAYVLADIDYLLKSHHSSTRPIKEADEILQWTRSITWLGLEIVAAPKPTNKEGFVTFKAHFLENGIKNNITENSRFVKENEHWVYIVGQHS